MKPLRVLVAGPPTLLRGIVERIAAMHSMEVANSHPERPRLHEELRNESADVVVLGLGESEVPDVCSQILDEFPGTTVVALAADGRRTSLYVDDLGPDALFETVHGLRRRRPDRRHPPTAREGER